MGAPNSPTTVGSALKLAIREEGGVGAFDGVGNLLLPRPLPLRGPGCGLPGRRSVAVCLPAVEGRLIGSSALGMRERGRPVETLGGLAKLLEESGLERGGLPSGLRRLLLLTDCECWGWLPLLIPSPPPPPPPSPPSPPRGGSAVSGLMGLKEVLSLALPSSL